MSKVSVASAFAAVMVAMAPVADAQSARTTSAAAGMPVTFRYGTGVNEQMVIDYANDVSEAGCPATARAGGIPGNVFVKTNGKTSIFSDPSDAAGWALDNCK